MTNDEWLTQMVARKELRAWLDSEHVETHNATLDGDTAALNAKIAELTVERDNWKANCEDWKKDCEHYREKFGKCLDYADAIHALMDDEGMA